MHAKAVTTRHGKRYDAIKHWPNHRSETDSGSSLGSGL